MRVGSLDQRIKIQGRTKDRNSMGEMVDGWLPGFEVWSRVIEAEGKEFLRGAIEAESAAVFQIRFRRDVESTARVIWRGRTYEIESVTGTRREGSLWLHGRALSGGNQ